MSEQPRAPVPFRRPGAVRPPVAAASARTGEAGGSVIVAFPSDAVRRTRPHGAGSAAFEAHFLRARPSFWRRALLSRCW